MVSVKDLPRTLTEDITGPSQRPLRGTVEGPLQVSVKDLWTVS